MPDLLEFTSRGIYCSAGDFYIDPWKPVERAVITHAHSDHARPGMQHYLAHPSSEPILRLRLGGQISVQAMDYNQPLHLNGVKVSFHPSGHLPGAAQVRVEHKGEIWVASGDYKVENDGLSQPFEPVRCHSFISECTFGLPVFNWEKQEKIFKDLNAWWQSNAEKDICSVVFAYALGKAQRIFSGLNHEHGPVFMHTAVYNTHEALRNSGLPLLPGRRWDEAVSRQDYRRALILATPSSFGSPWLKHFGTHKTAICSGWMAIRGYRRRSNPDRAFVLSDHADWPGLLQSVKATGAERIIATHGYTAAFSKYLQEAGFRAEEVKTHFAGERLQENEIQGS
jgi:putative mRNA 3-end processing factor